MEDLQRSDKPTQAGLPSVLTDGLKLLSDELNFQKRFRDLVVEKPEDAAASVVMWQRRLRVGPAWVCASGATRGWRSPARLTGGGQDLVEGALHAVCSISYFDPSGNTECHFHKLSQRNLGSHILMNEEFKIFLESYRYKHTFSFYLLEGRGLFWKGHCRCTL